MPKYKDTFVDFLENSKIYFKYHFNRFTIFHKGVSQVLSMSQVSSHLQKQASIAVGYAKLPLGVNDCVHDAL